MGPRDHRFGGDFPVVVERASTEEITAVAGVHHASICRNGFWSASIWRIRSTTAAFSSWRDGGPWPLMRLWLGLTYSSRIHFCQARVQSSLVALRVALRQ